MFVDVEADKKTLKKIGRRISEIRIERDMTQADLAEKLDVTDKYVQQIEYGQVNLPILTLIKIAKILNVDLQQFFKSPTTERAKPGRPPMKKT